MIKYVPVLRSKEGELKALKGLKVESYPSLTPFLNIHGPDFDWREKVYKKTLQEHLKDVAEKVTLLCPKQLSPFIDFDFDKKDLCEGVHYSEYFFRNLLTNGLTFKPMTGLDRVHDSAFQDVIKKTIKTHSMDVGIRLYKDDLELMFANHDDLVELIKFLEINNNRVHLFFDLKAINENEVKELSELIVEAAECMLALNEYATFTIISAGMPENMGKFETDKVSTHYRSDYALWRATSAKLKRKPYFGDYGILNPNAPEVDFTKMTRSSRIRYTDSEHWHIFKGHSLKKTTGGLQNPNLARAVLKAPVYRGPNFSFGDEYIEKCAAGKVTGNATNWVTADTNQHIEFVIKQISKSSSVL